MLVGTSSNPSHPLPARYLPFVVSVTAYATAQNPFDHEWQRVRVESVRLVNELGQGGEPPYKVASVCCLLPNKLPYDVRLPNLKNIAFQITMDIDY